MCVRAFERVSERERERVCVCVKERVSEREGVGLRVGEGGEM